MGCGLRVAASLLFWKLGSEEGSGQVFPFFPLLSYIPKLSVTPEDSIVVTASFAFATPSCVGGYSAAGHLRQSSCMHQGSPAEGAIKGISRQWPLATYGSSRKGNFSYSLSLGEPGREERGNSSNVCGRALP